MTQDSEGNGPPGNKRNKRSRRPIILTVLIVSSAFLLSIFSGIENWKRDLTTNYAKLDPQSADPLLRPLTLSLTPEQTAEAIVLWASDQPRWSIQSQQAVAKTIRLHLTHTTKLLRFTDDVNVSLVPIDAQTTRVEAESQSRLGKGDFGQNPRNLRELVSGLRKYR